MDNGLFVSRLVCLALLAGCAASPVSDSGMMSTSEPAFLSELDSIDTIRIEELTIDKRKDVVRFLEICRNAKWAPYIATLPADFESIEFLSSGDVEYQLDYAGGWLFDMTGDGTPRFGTLHVDDGDWLQKNIDDKLYLLRNAL
ncbi:MAG: hypothetical protein AAFX06_24975 [Planctomycetota bacterium]